MGVHAVDKGVWAATNAWAVLPEEIFHECHEKYLSLWLCYVGDVSQGILNTALVTASFYLYHLFVVDMNIPMVIKCIFIQKTDHVIR